MWCVKVPGLPFRAVLQLILCLSTSVVGIGRVLSQTTGLCSSVGVVHQCGCCYLRTVLYFLLKLLSACLTPGTCTESWLVAVILLALSLSMFVLLFHFCFLPLSCSPALAGVRARRTAQSVLSALQSCRVPGDTAVPG